MGSKGSQTTTQTTTPNPQAMAAYQSMLPTISGLGSIPFTPFNPATAGTSLTPEQAKAMGDINSYAGVAQPFYQQAGQLISGAANPLSTAQIQQYYSPFEQDVINATQARFDQTNKQALENVKGNAITQGALGGIREKELEGSTLGQLQLAQAPIIAGLENQGYSQALSTAAQQFQQNPMMAAYGLGNVGAGAQTAGLQGAGAEMGAGMTEQQQAYAQYLAQQGYPFQVAQLMAGLYTGVGSQMGGTGQTIAPPPNYLGQYAGLGVAALGAFAADGGRIKGYADGGMPFGGVGYVPSPTGVGGHGNMPAALGVPQQQQPSSNDIFKNAMEMSKGISKGYQGAGALGDKIQDAWQDATEDADTVAPVASDSAIYADGGNVQYPGGLSLPARNRIHLPMRAGLGMPSFVRKGYDDGGSPIANDFSYFDVPKPVQTVPVSPPGLSANEFSKRFGFVADEPPVSPQYNTIPSIGDAMQDRLQDAGYPDRDFTPDLPKEITGPTEIAGQGLGASSAFAPEDRSALRPVPPSGYSPIQRPELLPNQGKPSGFLGMTPEGRMGLIAMGLGMASAASRPGATFAGSIGEGGLAGLGTYAGYKNREADIAMRVEHLNQLAKQEARRYEEMTPYQKSEVEAKNRQLDLLQQERDKPRVVQSWKDQYGVEHHIYGIPGSEPGTWVDPITRKQLTVPPEAGGTLSPPAPSSSNVPQSAAEQPVKMASLGDVPIPEGMTLNGQKVTPRSLESTPAPVKRYNDKALEGLTPDDQAAVKALVNYDLLPNQLSTRSAQHADLIRSRALQYDSDYKPSQAANFIKARYDWDNGKHSDIVRNFSTAIDHIELLKGLIANLNNQQSPAWNALANAFKAEFAGQAPPTNYDAASHLIANEIVKATVGGQNALGDREEIAKNFNRNRSPEQQHGVIGVYEGLMAGQLHNLERQYRNATHADDFQGKYLSAKARDIFYGHGLGREGPSDKDRELAKSKPEYRERFIKHFGVEP